MRLIAGLSQALSLFCSYALLNAAYGLSVDLHGKEVHAEEPRSIGLCLNITGRYEGFRIEATGASKSPKICVSAGRVNTIKFQDVTVVATADNAGERTVRFEHQFVTGPIGLVYARATLKGFFTTATGVGVPTGNSIYFAGVFSQGSNEAIIGGELEQTVERELESALLDGVAREQYVISGVRTLKGILKFELLHQGDKLVLQEDSTVIIDNVQRLAE